MCRFQTRKIIKQIHSHIIILFACAAYSSCPFWIASKAVNNISEFSKMLLVEACLTVHWVELRICKAGVSTFPPFAGIYYLPQTIKMVSSLGQNVRSCINTNMNFMTCNTRSHLKPLGHAKLKCVLNSGHIKPDLLHASKHVLERYLVCCSCWQLCQRLGLCVVKGSEHPI